MIENLTNRQTHRKIFVRENLTLKRRLIWNRAKNELNSFRHKWVKNGKIFAQKHHHDRAICITTDRALNDLLMKSGNPGTKEPRTDSRPQLKSLQPSHYGVKPRASRRWPAKKLSNLSESRSRFATANKTPAFRRTGSTFGDFLPSHVRPSSRVSSPASNSTYRNAVLRIR